jgi:hypothetical protein
MEIEENKMFESNLKQLQIGYSYKPNLKHMLAKILG